MPIATVSADGALMQCVMKGAVRDYKATAEDLAAQLAVLRRSLAQESAANAALLSEREDLHRQINHQTAKLYVQHSAMEAIRHHWASFLLPGRYLWPEAE